MQQTTLELQDRTRRFAAGAATLCERLPADPGAQRTGKKLLVAAKAVVVGYQNVCASPTPEKFASGMSVVARQARRARACVQMLLQLDHVTIEACRDLLLEARALEAIFTASRNTAKKRHGRKSLAALEADVTRRRRQSRSRACRRPSSSGTP